MPKKLTHEEFLEKLWDKNEHYKNGDFTVASEYENNHNPIFLRNKYGICKVSPISLYGGCNITIMSAVNQTEYAIEQFKEVHGDKYDYSIFKYSRYEVKSSIICKYHGKFLSTAYAHINNKNGCSKCSDKQGSLLRAKSNEQFIKDVSFVHNNRYDYSLTNYITSHKKVEIICKIHGIFKQKAYAHLSGNGCSKCNEWKNFKIKWLNTKSNYGILYMCKFYNKFESFIKVGITTTSIKKRYASKKYSDFNYDIIEEIRLQDKNTIWSLEEQLKDILKYKKYKPISRFEGYSECYKIENFKEIYGEFKKITENYIT